MRAVVRQLWFVEDPFGLPHCICRAQNWTAAVDVSPSGHVMSSRVATNIDYGVGVLVNMFNSLLIKLFFP